MLLEDLALVVSRIDLDTPVDEHQLGLASRTNASPYHDCGRELLFTDRSPSLAPSARLTASREDLTMVLPIEVGTDRNEALIREEFRLDTVEVEVIEQSFAALHPLLRLPLADELAATEPV